MGMRDTVDAIVSAGGLHWIGDIVGSLTQVKHLLKPDGVFVGAVIGGDSLFELRSVYIWALYWWIMD
jgi:NADH dehydrogenase [ubiquinone] 1 alpha subcomplex assembly factor 5